MSARITQTQFYALCEWAKSNKERITSNKMTLNTMAALATEEVGNKLRQPCVFTNRQLASACEATEIEYSGKRKSRVFVKADSKVLAEQLLRVQTFLYRLNASFKVSEELEKMVDVLSSD